MARFMLRPKELPSAAPSAIDRPRCPKCYAKMTLARITPGSPGFEVRSLECPECEHAIAQRVAADLERTTLLPYARGRGAEIA